MDKNRLDTLEIEIVLKAVDIAKGELEKCINTIGLSQNYRQSS